MAKIDDFKKYNTFYSMLWVTKKYKECFAEHAGKISIFFTIIFSIMLCLLYNHNSYVFFSKIESVLITISAGLLGLLGVYITGLALMVSVITKESINQIDVLSKAESLVGVLFCYYFAGGFILITIFDFLLCYFLINLNIFVNEFFVYFMIILSCWLFAFSICYTVALLGMSINIFFVNLHLTKQYGYINQIKNQQQQKGTP